MIRCELDGVQWTPAIFCTIIIKQYILHMYIVVSTIFYGKIPRYSYQSYINQYITSQYKRQRTIDVASCRRVVSMTNTCHFVSKISVTHPILIGIPRAQGNKEAIKTPLKNFLVSKPIAAQTLLPAKVQFHDSISRARRRELIPIY